MLFVPYIKAVQCLFGASGYCDSFVEYFEQGELRLGEAQW